MTRWDAIVAGDAVVVLSISTKEEEFRDLGKFCVGGTLDCAR